MWFVGKRVRRLSLTHEFFELFATVFHVLNRSNEAQQGESSTVSPVCANFRQAFTQSAMEWVSATGDALGFGERVEGLVKLGVVGTEVDQCAAFAAHQVVEGGVVVAFVESPRR